MKIWELFCIAVGLAMDAFAVSVCKGLSVPKIKPKYTLVVGLYFGGFQAAMPLIGFFLAAQFSAWICGIGHWIAFGLLVIIGANMIRESRKEDDDAKGDSFAFRSMFPLAIATSIDALAVGVSFASLQVEIFPAVGLIGGITFLVSAAGLYIGNIFGTKFKSKAEVFGGVVLILIGLKILLEHLGVF